MQIENFKIFADLVETKSFSKAASGCAPRAAASASVQVRQASFGPASIAPAVTALRAVRMRRVRAGGSYPC